MRPLAAAGSLAAACTGALLLAGPALAVDEAQLSELSCTGLRVSQAGLPPGLSGTLEVLDPRSNRTLRETRVTTDATGRYDVRVAAPLRGLPRVDVELKVGDDEYAETGTDLRVDCRPALAAHPGRTSGTGGPAPSGGAGGTGQLGGGQLAASQLAASQLAAPRLGGAPGSPPPAGVPPVAAAPPAAGVPTGRVAAAPGAAEGHDRQLTVPLLVGAVLVVGAGGYVLRRRAQHRRSAA